MAHNITTVGWIPQPEGRGTFGLLCNCVFAIFLCLWTAYHPDIELMKERDSRGLKWFKRCFRSSVFLLCPGWLAAEAAKQYAQAKELTARLQSMGYAEWEITHSFYGYMNGFIAEDVDGNWRDLDFSRIEDLQEIDRGSIPSLTEIKDKSKADCIAKFIVCCQILFLAPQCITRAAQGLPISTLEVATLGYAAVSLMAYVYWWEKPYCVQGKIRLYRNLGVRPFPVAEYQPPTSLIGQLICKIESLGPAVDSMTAPISTVGGMRRHLQRVDMSEDLEYTATYDPAGLAEAQKCVSWSEWHTTEWPSLSTYPPEEYNSINDASRLQRYLSSAFYSMIDSSALLTANLVFALIHVSAWQFTFPTTTEHVLWRCFSLCPLVLIVLLVVVRAGEELITTAPGAQVSLKRSRLAFRTMFWIFVILLSCSRMYLFIEMFAALRRTSPGIYQSVTWTRYLPSIT